MKKTRAQPSLVRWESIRRRWHGYGACLVDPKAFQSEPDITTEEYARDQMAVNARKTREFIVPLLQKHCWRSVLDVGCGVGTMVDSLLDDGYDAFGVDLPGLVRHWAGGRLPKDRFFIVGTERLCLPFEDDSLDAAFSLGVIEHIGTSDGHTDRRPDYGARRRQWLREVYRVVRPGGAVLIGGPNRGFPVDVAHAPDSRASSVERLLSRMIGASFHKTWGRHFLWSYHDIRHYLADLSPNVRALSTRGLIYCGRVPGFMRAAVELYLRILPGPLLATGFNPWVVALISKGQRRGPGPEGRQVLGYAPLLSEDSHPEVHLFPRGTPRGK